MRDTSSNAGLQLYAKVLATSNGQRFFEAMRYFYRGTMDRILELSEKRNALPWDLPWTRADEQRWIYPHLRGSSERFLALRACVVLQSSRRHDCAARPSPMTEAMGLQVATQPLFRWCRSG